MTTKDDRNKPVDPFGTKRTSSTTSQEIYEPLTLNVTGDTSTINVTKKRLNDATPDEWNNASRGYKYPEIGTEDYFQGSLFDKADEATKYSSLEELFGIPENHDEVDEPKHYNYGKYETIDVIVDTLGEYEAINYCHGNVLKYTMRMWHKGKPITDCKKARWYLNKMIELLEKTEGINW
jgi:hypothetical protein